MTHWPNRTDKVLLILVFVFIVVLGIGVARGQAPAPPIESKPLTADGQKDADAIHWEIVKAQQKINSEIATLQQRELDRQHLKIQDGWSLNFDKDQLERRAPAPPAK